MRRREKSERVLGLPSELAIFDSSDWVGIDEAQRYSAWMRARSKWADARGIDVLPDAEAADAAFPDGEWRPEEI